MEKEMKGLAASADIGWVRVDAKPLKKSLETMVSKWSWTYIKYLQDKVVNEMDDLYKFVNNANHVLDLCVRLPLISDDLLIPIHMYVYNVLQCVYACTGIFMDCF